MFIKPYSLCFIALTFFACDTNDANTSSSESEDSSGYLMQFQSEAQVNEWLAQQSVMREESGIGSDMGFVEYAEAAGTDMPAPSEPTTMDSSSDSRESEEAENENITNNQEAEVDEGGIVKNIGDHLVILRRGHLFSVAIAESGETELTDSIAVAREEILKEDVWYDELLVKGNQIVVLGYRYLYIEDEEIYGSTEINTFTLSTDGIFERETSHWLESYDYYDSDNSASRLVNGDLVLYMPHAFVQPVYDYIDESNVESERAQVRYVASYPRKINYEGNGEFSAGERLVDPRNISYIDGDTGSLLHNIVKCPVLNLADEGSLDCQGHGVLSHYKEEMYVSASHAFLKVADQIFAISLGDESKIKRHKLEGQVQDQFAFKLIDDQLWVSLSSYSNSETDNTELSSTNETAASIIEDNTSNELEYMLVQLPLEEFNGQGNQDFAALNKITFARSDFNAFLMKQRYFAGSQFIAAFNDYGSNSEIKIVSLENGTVQSLELPGFLTRLELMGSLGTFMALQNEAGLQVATAVNLDSEAELRLGETLVGQAEAESRSHGFYFKPNEMGGYLGLPVISGDYYDWGSQSASIAFYQVNTDGAIDQWGTIDSGDQSSLNCTSSCVDWYGNTRPLFLKNRVYALMGGEITEVDLSGDEARQVGPRVLLVE